MKLAIIRLFFIFAVTLGAVADVNSATMPTVPIIDITADYFPGLTFHLGIELNPDHSVNRVYYENELGKKFFTMNELRNQVVIMKKQNGNSVYNLVFLSMNTLKKGSNYNFTLGYMRNGLWKNSITNANYRLRYNYSANRYEAVDDVTGRVISRAHVVTNVIIGKPVGIDKITTN